MSVSRQTLSCSNCSCMQIQVEPHSLLTPFHGKLPLKIALCHSGHHGLMTTKSLEQETTPRKVCAISEKHQPLDSSFRKSSCPYKCLPAILGLEMAAPLLWAPGIFAFFLQENPHAHKIRRCRGGILGFWGECRFHFYGRGDFSDSCKWWKFPVTGR